MQNIFPMFPLVVACGAHQADVSRVRDHSQTSPVLWEMSPVGGVIWAAFEGTGVQSCEVPHF